MVRAHKNIKNKLTGKQLKLLKAGRDLFRDWFDPFPYRRYMRKNKCIYIHIPKAAGTSILKALNYKGPRDHATYREFLKSSPTRFNNYFKFTLVRNPYDRIVSTYYYLKSGGNGQGDLLISNRIVSEGLDLNDFCCLVKLEKLYVNNPILWPQVTYLCDTNNRVMVDYVGRIETIEKDYEFIKDRIPNLKHITVENKIYYPKNKEFLNRKSQLLVQDIYSLDFKVFEYNK